jgi:(1->4)-alpha-D-glucan 1-alpha-D-glucosylmutase
MESILLALEHLPDRSETAPHRVTERYHETVVIRNRLQSLADQAPQVATHIRLNLDGLNGTPGDPHSFDELDRLLGEQAYQLVHWKAGSDEMNYRRFFDITELAAICMENREVFDETHRFLFHLAAERRLDGLRIDHIDGLFDPAQYLWRLQCGYVRALGQAEHARLATAGGDAPAWREVEPGFLRAMRRRVGCDAQAALENGDNLSAGVLDQERRSRLPLFVVVEKILGADEPLPAEWPVQGTTGYDFLNLLNGLFLDARGLRELQRYYARFTDQRLDLRETIYRCKRLIVEGAMQSELQLLAHRLSRLSNRHRRSRDYTLQALRAALREIIASFPVYRTYIRDRAVSDRDRRVVQLAVAQARRRNPAVDASVFDFIRDVVLMEQPPGLDAEAQTEREFFIGRLQQVTSPVMAKGVEDTAFYRHVPLVSINEVGSEPERALTTVAEFHRQNLGRMSLWPRSLLATTTHDTKRSEDVRARINVLTEAPGQWRSAVQRWARWNRRYRREVDGEPAPSRNDEWLFYQTLIGVWPVAPPAESDRAALVRRLQDYMEKAAHEAKLRTSWINPSPHYDAAVRDFVERVLMAPDRRFLRDFQTFHDSIVDSGLYTALAQVLLKLTCPGIPDVYQGQEIWDFSLVDPDNRRPVDFDRRRSLLGEIKRSSSTDDGRRGLARTLAANPRDDRLKLFVTWTALQFRRTWQDFENAEYRPLDVQGVRAEHVCAFAWVSPGDGRSRTTVVVVPRLIHTLTRSSDARIPCGFDVWQDTSVSLRGLTDAAFRELMTGRPLHVTDGALPLGSLLAEFPVALATTGWNRRRDD